IRSTPQKAQKAQNKCGDVDRIPKFGNSVNVPTFVLRLFFFFFFSRFLAGLVLGLLGLFGLLHFELASKKFDDSKIRAVAFAVAQLDDPAVATLAVGKAGSDGIEYLLGNRRPQKIRLDLPSRMKVVALAESNHLFGERA